MQAIFAGAVCFDFADEWKCSVEVCVPSNGPDREQSHGDKRCAGDKERLRFSIRGTTVIKIERCLLEFPE
jgi:hypothetical protein